jgi:hypothetical protein
MSDYNPMMTEKGTVDRAIEIEKRMEEIKARLDYLGDIAEIAGALMLNTERLEQEGEELESELSDLQKEYRE